MTVVKYIKAQHNIDKICNKYTLTEKKMETNAESE